MSKNWAHVDVNTIPSIKTATLPGPKSVEYHTRAAKYMKGYSSQVQLFPVAFDSGFGYTLTDVDGNKYIDFSSGIYVTGLGHCHPKISEAVAKHAKQLMNCHDFTTEIKMQLMEKLHEVTGGKFGGFQLYDSGTTAVEAGLRCARAQALISYRSFEGYRLTQSEPDADCLFAGRAASYERHQGDKLVARGFDAYSYLRLCDELDSHNLGRARGGVDAALSGIKAKSLVISITSDGLFPPEEGRQWAACIPGAQFKTIGSEFGHDGFLLETEQICKAISSFLG